MEDTVKYLIHADVTADGVVERSDVVGAVFGQTEGLLGDELDLRSLQQASKVGRIDVDVKSEHGQSFGHLTIETSLDKVETATLAAALETITRIGPCRAKVEITEIEDVRAAKRREVVERAKQLLTEGFADSVMSSDEILDAVREEVRVEDITEYEGLPAGPRVTDSDAVIVVEGRADVLTMLQYGIKNAVAVEGTNVPEAVADLTRNRTVTVFLDGDRGGDLILEELSQVGDIDYVAFAPAGRSVEDLVRGSVYEALQNKVPYDAVAEMSTPRDAVAATDGSTTPAPREGDGDPGSGQTTPTVTEADSRPVEASVGAASTDRENATGEEPDPESRSESEPVAETDAVEENDDGDTDREPESETLKGHVEALVGGDTGRIRLLDDSFSVLHEASAESAFDLVEDAESVQSAVVLDGRLDQRVLDIAAERGVDQIVARELGEFTKRPTSVRLRTGDQLID
jgi:DNA primase